MSLLGGFVLCIVAGALASLIIWPPSHRRALAAAAAASAGATGDTDSGASGSTTGTSGLRHDFADERDRLARGCMDLADRLRDDRPTLFRKALRDLADVGVAPVIPDGDRVDHDRHDVVGAKPTTDPGFDGAVASTERLGFTDRGVLVRRPQVIVWQGPEVLH